MACQGLRRIMKTQIIHSSLSVFANDANTFFSSLFPEVTCTQVWSLEQSATVATRSRLPTVRRVSATWSVKERRVTCAVEPTACPSIGWSWARSQHAAVSLTLSNNNKRAPLGFIGTTCWSPHTLTATGLLSKHNRAQTYIYSTSQGNGKVCPSVWLVLYILCIYCMSEITLS